MLRLFKKLKFLLLLIIIFTTGCTAKYSLTIDNIQNINEKLDVIEENKEIFNKKNSNLYNSTPEEYLETNLKWPTPAYIGYEVNPYEPIKIDGIDYYTKSNITNFKQVGIRYSFNYYSSNYLKSNVLNECYDTEVLIQNNVLTFKTLGEFKCFDKYKNLDEVEVSVSTKCEMINHNSKEQNNSYNWNITKENYKKQQIEFKLDCTQIPKKKNNYFNTILVIVIYALVVILIFGLAKFIGVKNNKI